MMVRRVVSSIFHRPSSPLDRLSFSRTHTHSNTSLSFASFPNPTSSFTVTSFPNNPETFVQRSGLTGRAGKEGTAILWFTGSQRSPVRSLERVVGRKFEFVSPPAVEEVLESRSLISHEQGWVTLLLTRDSFFSRGFLSARSVTEFLSDVYPAAAEEVGKIHLIADGRVQIAVFDVPEEIAKKLLTKQLSPGNSISRIRKLLPVQDEDSASRSGGSFRIRNENSWSWISRSSGDGDDWSSRLSSRDKRIVIVTMTKALVTIVKYSLQYLFRLVCVCLTFALLVRRR